MANESGFRALEAMIDRAKVLGGIASEVAKEVAPALKTELTGNIAAGRGPDGEAWQKTQEGAVPLKNAAKALTVIAQGPIVLATLEGPEARHHKGTAKGRIKRRILPSNRNIPKKTVEAIKIAASRVVRGL